MATASRMHMNHDWKRGFPIVDGAESPCRVTVRASCMLMRIDTNRTSPSFSSTKASGEVMIATLRITATIFALALCCSPAVFADEVTLIAPGGIRGAIVQLIPGFEQKTGHKVNATFGSGGGTKQQVVRGEVFDVVIVQPPYPDVIASGNVIASSETPLASVAVGVAVRQGERKPDISTPAAVKRMHGLEQIKEPCV
jgi:ABC-type molybdate transport system substrate-binding protein